MLHWQAKVLARFLAAAAEKADWLSVKQEEGTLVFIAGSIAGSEKTEHARLEVTTNYPFTVTFTDEWGLLD